MCLKWSVLHGRRICPGCERWKYDHPQRGVCPRCRHEAHLGRDGFCKPCLQAIRAEDDAEWALRVPGVRPRALQLTVGSYRHYAIRARPIVESQSSERWVSAAWKTKLNRQHAVEQDHSALLEPQMWGQLPLFTMARTLTRDTGRALATRPLSGWDRAEAVLLELTARWGMGRDWRSQVTEMVRIALALREADGVELTCEQLLRSLPRLGDVVCEVLLGAGLVVSGSALELRLASRSCGDCGAWMAEGTSAGFLCDPCREWRRCRHYQPGQCARCGRDGLALGAGHCRACHPYRTDGQTMLVGQQLAIDLPARPDGPNHAPPTGAPVPDPADTPASTLGPGQEELFTMRRDWSPVLARLSGLALADVPLSEAATALVEDFAELRRDLTETGLRKNVRTLTFLVYWLGVANAVHERDIYDLAQLDGHLAAKPVCQFLRTRGLLIDDPALHRDRDLVWLERVLATLPPDVADEVRAWADVLRTQGPRQDEPRSWESIRSYLTHLRPVLTAWTQAGMTSLREATADHLQDALDALDGAARRQLAITLRSLFRVLKREKLVFRDLARGLPVGDLTGIPRPVPSDVLAGLLDRATTAFARLAIALAAVHAVPASEIRTALAADLNLARGTLVLRRGMRRHTLYLEEFTHRLAADWLTYRHRRWPTSVNPHLLVTQKTALDPDHPAVGRITMQLNLVLPKGQTLDKLRQDRILDEAFATGDPLKLMRLFGITEDTAMRYVTTAYPERTAKLPR
ncbi:site-specific integrase [Kitasatospora humi]|uniref:site-specific integrase n=1 Tax=Kitasatospora humi TaxID=2893891 RepID=UPI0027DF2DD6|nr:site-specific integrase [Kitasatospora humi]